ncbi:helix-turn-helix domain-containing protein [Paludibacterium denitrificans]|uniref:helix-turn-helix domain-containing protein n=1 Tax=Paludibacterium denitrificans TaxID=2675226 RepID=UPI002478118E|nr:helix-turn-helix domain-containing protein [Paludibacterium denitrificans]
MAEEVARRLRAGEIGIIDDLTRRFEETCIRTGLAHTGGRKVEAAHILGWGRNTLTRKIQELGMEQHDDEAHD